MQRRVIDAGQSVSVQVPATTANLGPGFDSLGLALGFYDELTVESTDTGELEFSLRGEGAAHVPRSAEHLVVKTIDAALGECGFARSGIRLRAHNVIPHGRGLGSSAAAIVAGLTAAVALLPAEQRPDTDWVFQQAAAAEGHPDNVAPAVYGGLTVSWSQPAAPGHAVPNYRTAVVPVHSDVQVLVAVPDFEVATKLARSLIPADIPHAAAAANSGRAALLIHALSHAPQFLLDGTEEYLHQRYRRQAMPSTLRLVESWRGAGIAGVISGAGPTALALANSPEQLMLAAHLAEESSSSAPWRVLKLGIDTRGAKIKEHR